MLQYHYVVVGVLEEVNGRKVPRFWVDQETCDARFDDGVVWNTDDEDWYYVDPYDKDDQFLYQELIERL